MKVVVSSVKGGGSVLQVEIDEVNFMLPVLSIDATEIKRNKDKQTIRLTVTLELDALAVRNAQKELPL